jgi:peptidoglycan/xylan/chitin deacetylase (PgdA/CDA1 family)
MALRSHGRYGYVPIIRRRPYDWPNGTRLAVFIAVNLEHFPFGEGLGIPLAPAQPEPDVVNYSWRDYGNRVGVWRLLELFDALALPVSLFVNTAIYDHCPEVVEAFRARGDEIVAHGRTNAERQGTLAEADERRLIAETTEAIRRHEGRAPTGWMGPWVSESACTPDLLHEAGYRYVLDWCADDQPIWLRTRGGRILSVPYPRPVGDLAALHHHAATPSQYADLLIDQFDEMLRQSAGQPLVSSLSFHPYLVGWPFRLKHLRRALEHIAARREQVWLAHSGAIADHAIALPDGIVP